MQLKQPIQVGTLTLKNRLVMPPMAIKKCGTDGVINDAFRQYYKDRAAGGDLGLIIMEHAYVARQGMGGAGQYGLEDDSNVELLKELLETMHKDGTKVFAQINHTGSAAFPEVTQMEVVGPSAIENPGHKTGVIPRELTLEEIQTLEKKYISAAIRAKTAGFDGVEIHSAHGYLLNQFYSPLSNLRKDEYGADCIENRIRAHLNIYRGIRQAVGPDYPIALRLGGCDYMEGGSTIEDAVTVCKIFEQEGIDLLDITGGMCGFVRKDCTDPGYFGDTSAAVRAAVSVPVILTGGIRSAAEAEQLLANGAADLIGVGRPIFADADWAKKEMNQANS